VESIFWPSGTTTFRSWLEQSDRYILVSRSNYISPKTNF
jgi:hypothetical protein